MKNIVILENIRSAYNVGNIIRTADALGYDVILSGFIPHPFDDEKVRKTSLGSEEHVGIQQFWNPLKALKTLKEKGYILIAAEIVEGRSVSLTSFSEKTLPPTPFPKHRDSKKVAFRGGGKRAIIFGNENTGVLEETLDYVDHIVHIPMQGVKESLNVGQAAAIFMRELAKIKRLKD